MRRASLKPQKAWQMPAPRITPPRHTRIRLFHIPRRLPAHSFAAEASLLRRRTDLQAPWQIPTSYRLNSDLAAPSPSLDSPDQKEESTTSLPLDDSKVYKLYFTCKPCLHRSGPHQVSKQGFHHGSTVITCPSCKRRHVITDHLRIFTEQGGDLMDIMERHGVKLKRGKLTISHTESEQKEEMIEFWESGSETSGSAQQPTG